MNFKKQFKQLLHLLTTWQIFKTYKPELSIISPDYLDLEINSTI